MFVKLKVKIVFTRKPTAFVFHSAFVFFSKDSDADVHTTRCCISRHVKLGLFFNIKRFHISFKIKNYLSNFTLPLKLMQKFLLPKVLQQKCRQIAEYIHCAIRSILFFYSTPSRYFNKKNI